jgi:MHS family proline/betaine transporter-like MFS transporter
MNKHKLILTSSVANSFEWYDYALFGHFAPIIGQKFFPNTDPSISLLYAFLAFAVGYLMRPIGGIFFGVIGDKFGRRVALSASVICMAFPTAAIGFLPTYETAGIAATSMMILVRMLQGLSIGGALTGSISFVIEHTEKNHRGFTSSFSMASICVGILFGSLVSYLIKSIFTPEQFNSWAWRLPFLIGIFIFFAGIYIKKHTAETPLFLENKSYGKVEQRPLKFAFKHHWFDMLISILINGTGSVIFYVESIYLISYLKIHRGFGENEVSNLVNICYIIMIVVTILGGWLSDKIGRRKIFAINLVIIILTSTFLLESFEFGNFSSIIIAQIIIAILAALYIGPEPALQAELYPTNIRSTALSVSYNTATSIFGGTAPYIMESLVQNGNMGSGSIYIIVCAVLSLIALYFYIDRSQQVVRNT